MKNRLTVAEALEKAKAQEPLQDYQVDFTHRKVEALEAMQLAKAGVEVPEDSIYYDDAATAEDEAFEGDWVPVATDGLAEAEAALNLSLQLSPAIRAWLARQSIPTSQFLERLLVNFYRAEQLIEKGRGAKQNLYYAEENIQYDEATDELTLTSGAVELSWAEKAKKAAAIRIDLSAQAPEIDDWLLKNEERVAALLRPIVISLFEAEQRVKEEDSPNQA